MKVRFPSFRRLGNIAIDVSKKVIRTANRDIRKSIRIQLIITFAVCLIASIFITIMMSEFLSNKTTYLDYNESYFMMDRLSESIAYDLSGTKYSIQDKESIQNIIESRASENTNLIGNIKILLVDLDGNVLFKSKNAPEIQVDLHKIIRNAMDDMRNDRDLSNKAKEIFKFYPLNLRDAKLYVIVGGIPQGIEKYGQSKDSFGAVIVGFASFIILFLLITKKKMKYLEDIASGLLEISKGNLEFQVPLKSRDELGSLAGNINYMAWELKRRIDEERRIERVKNELITNVSHDLRTPLTSIMGYLGLLKDGNNINGGRDREYIDIAYAKAERLKLLIDDLFDYTKLTDAGIKLNKETISINKLLEQLIEELVPICQENNLTFIREIPKEKIMANVDGDKMVRVFENLLMNAIRYSEKPGNIKVILN